MAYIWFGILKFCQMKKFHFDDIFYSDAEIGYLLFIAFVIITIVGIGIYLIQENNRPLE